MRVYGTRETPDRSNTWSDFASGSNERPGDYERSRNRTTRYYFPSDRLFLFINNKIITIILIGPVFCSDRSATIIRRYTCPFYTSTCRPPILYRGGTRVGCRSWIETKREHKYNILYENNIIIYRLQYVKYVYIYICVYAYRRSDDDLNFIKKTPLPPPPDIWYPRPKKKFKLSERVPKP